MKITNLTPHTINFINEDKEIFLSIESQGIARVSATEKSIGDINGIPVVESIFGEITGLPDEAPETIYIASRIVADAARAKGRTDVYSVGRTIREGSTILGCVNLM